MNGNQACTECSIVKIKETRATQINKCECEMSDKVGKNGICENQLNVNIFDLRKLSFIYFWFPLP